MSPNPPLRRTTRAIYAGHGVVLGRIENERRLLHGIRDNYAFVVPERGAWEFLYRGATYLQRPGVLQLKQPGELFRDLRRDGAASYEIMVFDPALLASARDASAPGAELVFDVPQLVASSPRAAPLLRLWALSRRAAGEDAARDPLQLEGAVAEATLALVALSVPARGAGQERRPVQRAKAYLRERLEQSIRLDELADHVRLDKYHLIRAFRAQVGVPPYEYLTHLRVYRARELLRAGATAAAAANTVGFYDQSQLHRHFVRLMGVTPGRYAATARTDDVALALGSLPRASSVSR